MFKISDLIHEIDVRSGGRLASRCLDGAENCTVSGFGPIESARPDQVVFLAQPRLRAAAKDCKAGVLVISESDLKEMYGDSDPARPVVVTANPYAWFAWAVQVMLQQPQAQGRIEAGAFVHPAAKVDPTAVVETGAFVKAGAVIGAHSVVKSGACVGEGTTVGEDVILYPNVVIYPGCRIGNRVIIHSGAVIGADGFGFAPFMGEWVKIPQVGGVTISDDVEIGANTTIDRGAIEDTFVGKGTKIDNQIQLGHNCRVGEHTVMAACTGVAGSTHIGSHCIIGGAAMINGHITIPDGGMVGPATSLKTWEKGARAMIGFFPAQEQRKFERNAVVAMNLTTLRRQVKDLQAQVEALTARLEKTGEGE